MKKDQSVEEKVEDTKEAEEKKEESSDDKKEPEKTTIFYVTDEISSRASISICSVKQAQDAVIMKHNIDAPFITHLEQKA